MPTKLSSLLLLFMLTPVALFAQVIDFETLPSGDPTTDQQLISTEYGIYGVSFVLLDPVTGLPIGVPRIAKAGPPRTAFQGCYADDTPLPGLSLGSSFLTDGNAILIEGDVLVEYATPVAQASGVILDIDCRVNGGLPCEQWTITAFDAFDTPLQTVIIDGPVGPPNLACEYPDAGPGDSQAFGWTIDNGTAEISSILLKYTGTPGDVGLAFDNFSVASLPGPPLATVSSPADTICAGEALDLSAVVSEGVPPYSYQWQIEAGSVWIDLGTGQTETVHPITSTSYRVIVTDSRSDQSVSDPLTLEILADDPLCASALLVSSNTNNSVVRYSFRSRLPQVFVSSGSGGLNAPSKLTCGPDDNLYVVSQGNDRVLRYSGTTGQFIDTFVTAGSGGLDIPVGLDFGPDGNLYVASFQTNAIIRYEGSTGALIDTFIPNGSGLNGPTGIVFGSDGNLYICSWYGDKVLRYDDTGAFIDDFVAAGSGGLDAPRGLVFGPNGELFVSEQSNDSVRRYDGTTGAFLDVFVGTGSGGLDRANDVIFGVDDQLYVASFQNDKVLEFDGQTGNPLGALPDDEGLLNGPAWFALSCRPYATAVGPVLPGPRESRVRFHVGYDGGVGGPATLRFELDRDATVDLTIYDSRGRRVADLLQAQFFPAGTHGTMWRGVDDQGRRVARGLYFAQLRVSGDGLQEAVTRKVLALR
jgi:WD40 repeat protein